MKCLRNIPVVFFILIGVLNSYAQHDGFHKEFQLRIDNDALQIKGTDKYYTFGLEVGLSFRTERFLGLQYLFSKKEDYFFRVRIKQEGYTPFNASSIDEYSMRTDFDRPFAGILYGELGVTYTFQKSFLRMNILTGVMGGIASSNEVQNWFHREIFINSAVPGWEYQLPNQAIFNLSANYAFDFMPNNDWFSSFGILEGRVGNLFTDFTSDIGIRVGKFNAITSSSAFGNGILAPRKNIEIFLQSTIGATIVVFDATAQGNLFNPNSNFGVDNFSHFYITSKNGIYVSRNKVTAGFELNLTFDKVIPNQQHNYGSAFLQIRF